MNSGKNRVVFAAYMAGGIATVFQNLKEAIGTRQDMDSAWVPVEMDEESKRPRDVARRAVIPGSIRNSMRTGAQIRKLEKSGGKFDAAYFTYPTLCMFLWRFRRRVPYLVAMDWTPLWCAERSLWYAHPPFDPSTLGSRMRQALIRRVYDRAFHLLPWSWGCRESLIRDYGIPPERITVVPPGIDLRRYVGPDRTVRAEVVRPFNVLFVGADFLRKGGDLLASLAREREFKDVQFNFVTRAYQGPTGDNIRVFNGLTANSVALVNLFREADVFCLPTRAETHSIASLEAMAMGLPVITTPVGGIVDIVQEGETGCLIACDDIAALADRLRMLKHDRGRRLRMGLSARRRVESHFNAETITATVVDLLRRAAASRPKGVHGRAGAPTAAFPGGFRRLEGDRAPEGSWPADGPQ